MKNTNNLVILDPVRIYENPETQKDLILEENKGKTGIYR